MTNKTAKKRRRTISLFVLFTLVLTGVFSAANLNVNSKFDGDVSKTKPIYEAKEGERYSTFNDSLVVSTGSSVKIINKHGKEALQTKFYSQEASFKTAGKYLLVADNIGGELLLIQGKKVACQVSGDRILFSKLSNSGDFIVATNSKIAVYNKKGKEKLVVPTDYYSLDAEFFGDQIVVSGFTNNGSGEVGVVRFYSKTGEELHKAEHKGELFSRLESRVGKIVVASDDKMLVFNNKYVETTIDFAGKTLNNYYITSFGKIICFFTDGAHSSLKETYSLRGRLKSQKTLDISATNFTYNDKGFSFLSDELYIYNSFGWLKKKAKVDKTVIGMAGKAIYILEGNFIKYIKL
ncbi:DUF5711 family protein [Treponema sp. R6D11]